MSSYKPRYDGVRWSICAPGNSGAGICEVALVELQRALQESLPYVLAIRNADAALPTQAENLVLLGTPASHRLIRDLIARELIQLPAQPSAFTVARLANPWPNVPSAVVLAGGDDCGALYAVQEFNAQLLSQSALESPRLARRADFLPDAHYSDFPRVENRGIWTWGYPIYDYRRYFDNMARLKLNMITIWNDCVPLNAARIIEYAHQRGIQVIFGFHWGWGLDYSLDNPEHCRLIKEEVLRNYQENYAHLKIDGIYFQTLTETHDTQVRGRSIASLACELANSVGRSLLEKHPRLLIQFGLHASSIVDNYHELKDLDSRITIVWEDAGTLPYDYYPRITFGPPRKHAELLGTFEKTLAYTEKIATFRGNIEFGMVPKGWWCIDWKDEFEHHGPFILGERSARSIRQRAGEQEHRWNGINQLWFKLYPYAAKFYRRLREFTPAKLTVTGLVEDGLFEARIQPSVALFGEMLWNPTRSDGELLARAMSEYYQ